MDRKGVTATIVIKFLKAPEMRVGPFDLLNGLHVEAVARLLYDLRCHMPVQDIGVEVE